MSKIPFSMLALFAAMNGGMSPIVMRSRKVKQPTMPLSAEEIEKLASLSGKAKKAYVRELKAKYGV